MLFPHEGQRAGLHAKEIKEMYDDDHQYVDDDDRLKEKRRQIGIALGPRKETGPSGIRQV